MRVLSLFDGMACGMLALLKIGAGTDSYDAYEIDKYATATVAHNFPFIRQHGDVFQADFSQYQGVDLLIGGSPCTYWSIAQKNNRETEAHGLGWDLFQQYVRAVKEARPRVFLYENNKSMSPQIRASIDEAFGFGAVYINSALVSAQNRQRLYWVGVRNDDGTYSKIDIEQPDDKGIFIKDILESGWVLFSKPHGFNKGGAKYEKAPTMTANGRWQHNHLSVEPVPVCVQEQVHGRKAQPDGSYDRRYEAREDGKSGTLTGTNRQNAVAIPILPVENVGECNTIQKALPKLADKYGHIPEIFNAYNLAELASKSPTLSTGSMVTSSCATTKFERLCDFCAFQGSETCANCVLKNQKVYEVKDGKITINGKQYPVKLPDGYYIIRKLTVEECKRLQTVPEWFDFSPISNAQAYKLLGNGWTVDVIAHILSRALKMIAT